MKRNIAAILCILVCTLMQAGTSSFPSVTESEQKGFFPLSSENAATIITDADDFKVVHIAAQMLADDIKRVTGKEAGTASTSAPLKEIFSIHAGDFTAEWRRNVLHGYSSRQVCIPAGCSGTQTIRISLLDPGIVLQEVLVH